MNAMTESGNVKCPNDGTRKGGKNGNDLFQNGLMTIRQMGNEKLTCREIKISWALNDDLQEY